jgi:hypothetical protein
MRQQTHMQMLLQEKLGSGRPLAQYVRIRQAEGLGWRRIADDIRRDTGLTVSHEALRTWFATDAAA